jgi:uncharacterized protein (DUF1778 family)
MSDERAEYYQQHKDDGDVWGEDESSAPDARQRPLRATITVRLTPDDAALLRRAAKALDVGYSEVVRKALEAFLRPKFTIEAGTSRTVDLMTALKESVQAAQREVTLTSPRSESATGRPADLAKSA